MEVSTLVAQNSDSRHEFDKRSEILSDATDLDVLLAAILDDQSPPAPVPAPVKAWPRQASEARREPIVVAAPPVATVPDTNRDPLILPVDDAEGGADALTEFLSESQQQALKADANLGHWGGHNSLVRPAVRRRRLVTGSIIGLVAIGTVYFGADRSDYFGADRGDSVGSPSLAASVPIPVPAAAPVETPATPAPPAPRDDLAPAPQPPPPAQARVIVEPPPQSLRSSPIPSIGTSPVDPVPVAAGGGNAPTPVAFADVDTTGPTSPPVVPAAVAPAAVAENAAPVTTTATPVTTTAAPVTTTAAPVTTTAAPVTTTAAPPVPADAQTTPARLLTGGVPAYPTALRTARVGGLVEVRFTIDSAGRVINVRSVTGPPQLRSVAEAAVRRWRYEPAQRGNVAVESESSVNFNFDPSAPRRPEQ